MLRRLLAALAVASLGCAALAQGEDVRPLPGDKELGIGGQWMNSNGTDFAHVVLDVTYHFQPQLAGEFAVMYLRMDEDDAYGISASAKFLLSKEGPTVPYLQAGGILYDGMGESDTTFLLGAGVQHYISKTQAFYLDFKTFRPDGADDWVYVTSIGFRFGF